MRPEIRPFAPEDRPAAVDIHNAIYPDSPTTLEERLRQDEGRRPDLVYRRFAAEQGGRVVGVALFSQLEWQFHPRKFSVSVSVHPDAQGRGVGAALWTLLLGELEPLEPLTLRGWTREDQPRALRFAASRGFVEAGRSLKSRLAVPDFDPAPFAARVEGALAGGVEIRSYAELAGDPERDRKLHALDLECSADEHTSEPVTPPSLERYREAVFAAPDFLPDAYFVAVREGEYLGVSYLTSAAPQPHLNTGFTAVRRPYRGRGLALALKVRALEQAKAMRAPEIRTDNAATNAAMLAINEKLGFKRWPDWIELVKVVREET